MVEKGKLIEELQRIFLKTKSELLFNSDYEKINEIFFLEDGILEQGFVSDKFDRQLCLRLVSKFYSWNSQLHAWLMPPPGDLITNTEYKKLDEEDKRNIRYMIEKAMFFLRADKINGFNKDKAAMGRLIDEMVEYNSEFSDLTTKLLIKIKGVWNEELTNERKI